MVANELENLDEAAAALSALAYLLERKAWLLLPVEEVEPEFDEPLELPDPTAYEYRTAIAALQEWHETRSNLFFRSPDLDPGVYELPYTLGDVSVSDLARAFDRLLRRAQPDAPPETKRTRKSLEEQMRIVLSVMASTWQTLDDMVTEPFTRSDLVYWFLALLELMRLGQVLARMEDSTVQFALAQCHLRLED